MLRLGLVGVRRGSSVVGCLKHFDGVEIAAVCDRDEARARAAAETFGDGQAFTDYADLLDAVDAVVIATPPTLHARMSIQALDAGRHVLCEVPAVDTLAEARALADATARSNATYMFAENSNFSLASMQLANIAAAGLFGEIYHMEAEYLHDVIHLFHDEGGLPTWRHDYEGIKYCTHSIGPLLSISGRTVTRAVAMETGRPNRRVTSSPRPDASTALFQLDNGGTICYRRDFSSIMPAVRHGHRYFIQGTKGSAEIPFRGDVRGRVYLPEDGRTGGPWTDLTDPSLEQYCPQASQNLPEWAASGGHGTAEYFMLREFLSAIEEGRPPAVGIREALAMTLPGIAALESARNGGAPVDLDGTVGRWDGRTLGL